MQRGETYGWKYLECNDTNGSCLPHVLAVLDKQVADAPSRVFDLGCGNGSVAAALSQHKWSVSGVDTSSDGIQQARIACPRADLRLGSAYDDLVGQFGVFPAVISLDVVEHVYYPPLTRRRYLSYYNLVGLQS